MVRLPAPVFSQQRGGNQFLTHIGWIANNEIELSVERRKKIISLYKPSIDKGGCSLTRDSFILEPFDLQQYGLASKGFAMKLNGPDCIAQFLNNRPCIFRDSPRCKQSPDY